MKLSLFFNFSVYYTIENIKTVNELNNSILIENKELKQYKTLKENFINRMFKDKLLNICCLYNWLFCFIYGFFHFLIIITNNNNYFFQVINVEIIKNNRDKKQED